MLQRQAEAGEQCGAFPEAIAAINEAIAARKLAGDIVGLGDALRVAARLYWLCGQSELAEALAAEALEVLRDHPDTWQYAMALSSQSQLDMLAERNELSIARGLEAMARAETFGCSDMYLHALTNLTASRCSLDVESGVAEIVAAIAETHRRQQPDLVPRLYANLTYMMASARHYPRLFEPSTRGSAPPRRATMRRSRPISAAHGRWRCSIWGASRRRSPRPSSSVRPLPARHLPLQRAHRAGACAAAQRRGRGRRTGRGTRHCPPRSATSCAGRRSRSPTPRLCGSACRARAPVSACAPPSMTRCTPRVSAGIWPKPRCGCRYWASRHPLPPGITQRLPAPHRAHVSGAWREAAAAWAELGCPYEQALALSAGDEGAQREALALFDRLGAAAAAARLRRQMRAGGARAIPRGPIAKTRASPAGLTRRQSEVFALLVKGLSNAQIARRLSIAPKTAEHHVSAIMARIGVTTRGGRGGRPGARTSSTAPKPRGHAPQRWCRSPMRGRRAPAILQAHQSDAREAVM